MHTYPCDYKYAKRSMHDSSLVKRCCDRFDSTEPIYGYKQTLFPITRYIQGLRTESAEKIASFEREGNAIGGLSVGEPADEMYAP